MAFEKNVLSLVDFGSKKRGAPAVGVSVLHEPAVGFSDVGLAGARSKPQHLIGLLFAHGSRARRSTLPRTGIELSVFTPSGKPAVKIRV